MKSTDIRCPLRHTEAHCGGYLRQESNPDRYVCAWCLRLFSVAEIATFWKRTA